MKINKFDEKNVQDRKPMTSGVNLLPDYIIDAFYNRIENKLNYGHNVDSKSIQVEIDRIMLVNGSIPDKIITLLDSFR